MFGKKFFSTVALSGATVSLVGNVGSVFAEKISNILLTCKDSRIDYDAVKDDICVKNENRSWSLQEMVRLFRLDRSETEKILCRIKDLEDVRSPLYHRHFRFEEPGCAQVTLVRYASGMIEISKVTDESFFDVKAGIESDLCVIAVNKKHAEEMLKTDLDTIDFSNCHPDATKKKERPWRMYY